MNLELLELPQSMINDHDNEEYYLIRAEEGKKVSVQFAASWGSSIMYERKMNEVARVLR